MSPVARSRSFVIIIHPCCYFRLVFCNFLFRICLWGGRSRFGCLSRLGRLPFWVVAPRSTSGCFLFGPHLRLLPPVSASAPCPPILCFYIVPVSLVTPLMLLCILFSLRLCFLSLVASLALAVCVFFSMRFSIVSPHSLPSHNFLASVSWILLFFPHMHSWPPRSVSSSPANPWGGFWTFLAHSPLFLYSHFNTPGCMQAAYIPPPLTHANFGLLP